MMAWCLEIRSKAELDAVRDALRKVSGEVYVEDPRQPVAQNMLARANELDTQIVHELAVAGEAGPEPDFPSRTADHASEVQDISQD